jgi:hypothetical protein
MGAHSHLLLLARVEIEKAQLQRGGIVLNGYYQLPPRPKQHLTANHFPLGLYCAK